MRYCCGSGLSRPRSLWIAAAASGVYDSARITVAGSPGIRWMSMNTPTVTRNAVGTISARRRTMYSITCGLAQPHPREAVDAVGDELEALDLLGADLGHRRIGREHVRTVADDGLLGLLV